VWKDSSFIVPSERFPGKVHVWELSWLLIKGRKNIMHTYRGILALSHNRPQHTHISKVDWLRQLGC